jgi:hypothetical protein
MNTVGGRHRCSFLVRCACAKGSVWEFYCSDAKSACTMKEFVVFDDHVVLNSPNYEVQCTVVVRSELLIDKFFDIKS